MSRLSSPRVSLFVPHFWSCIGLAATVRATPTHAEVQHFSPGNIEQGQTYAAGTRLRIPKGTASFEIPSGWHAQQPKESEAIILLSEARDGFIMVFMMLNLTEEARISLLAEPITHDLVFEPSGPVTKLGICVMANYKAGSFSGQVISVMGPGRRVSCSFSEVARRIPMRRPGCWRDWPTLPNSVWLNKMSDGASLLLVLIWQYS